MHEKRAHADQEIVRRLRKVHLDFHTPYWVEGVGRNFDADAFGARLDEARVDHICVFGKCCHGMSYYDTKIGRRHPNLHFDLLGEMVRALRARGIGVSIYYSVVWDDLVGEEHPEWAQRDREGKPKGGYGHQWRTVCVNSPYTDEILLPQVEEIVKGYSPDELWFDMVWVLGEECFCEYCRAKMVEMGLDPQNRADRVRFSDWTDENFVARTSRLVRELDPAVAATYNNCVRVGARRKRPHMSVFEIESLPHGWGYWYFPLYARYIRTLDIPVKGMTCRFHRFWGDFGSLKPAAQLQYEAATMLAQGAGCVIGDQLDPGGRLDEAAYATIGEVFRFVEAREAASRGWKARTQIAVLADDEPGSIAHGHPSDNLWGITKILIETHHQFDVIDAAAELDQYELVILADAVTPSAGLLDKLERYLAGGGRLLLTHCSLANAPQGWWERHLGLRYAGESHYSVDYLRVRDEQLGANLPKMDLIVYGRFAQIEPVAKWDMLAATVHPLAERTPDRYMSHLHASPGAEGAYPAVVARGDQIVYFAGPIFAAYFKSGNPALRQLVANGIERLVPRPLVRTTAPLSMELTVLSSEGRTAVHLVNYSPAKRGDHLEVVEEVRPLFDIPVEVALDRQPARAYTVPGDEQLAYEWRDGYARVVVPRVDVHTIVCFD